MTKEQMPVTIDSREPSDTHAYFLRHEDVADIETKELPTADVLVGGVAFERKTPEDFAGAVMDDETNIYDQAERMCEAYDHCYIVVEGSVADFERLTHTNIPAKALRGAAASLTARYCPVLFVGDGDEEADKQRLVDMCMRIGRKHNENATHTFIKGSAAGDGTPVAQRMYGCIEGVGPSTAEQLHEAYPTVESLTGATIEGLQAIEGIGEEKAKSIYRALREA